jgi:hypothetical protein
MTDPYYDPIEEAEKAAKDPETSPQATDWPKVGDKQPAEPEEEENPA